MTLGPTARIPYKAAGEEDAEMEIMEEKYKKGVLIFSDEAFLGP